MNSSGIASISACCRYASPASDMHPVCSPEPIVRLHVTIAQLRLTHLGVIQVASCVGRSAEGVMMALRSRQRFHVQSVGVQSNLVILFQVASASPLSS